MLRAKVEAMGGTVADLRAGVAFAAAKTTVRTMRERLSKGEVSWSPDLERVISLKRREQPDLELFGQALTKILKKPEGTQTLRDLQAWVLAEMPQTRGGIGLLQTGAGKTLLGMLMPMVWPHIEENGELRPPRCLLLIPSDLRAQFESDWERYGKHWHLPNLAGGRFFTPGRPVLHVVSYSEFQTAKNSALVDQINPDLVMADECSALRNFETARVRRMKRFFAEHTNAFFCGWDATITSDSLEDYWHLLVWSLGPGSPVPVVETEIRRWARAIDPERYEDGYWMPGALMRLCEAGESVRSGFRRRLVSTPGVVPSADKILAIPLKFKERRPPKMPDVLIEHLKVLRRPKKDGGWKRPDGELFTMSTQVVACARQLSQGVWLYWAYPRGEPREMIDDWFSKRQSWNRELRSVLDQPRVHMDSPKLCENAAKRWYDGGCPSCARGPLEDHAVFCTVKEDHPLWDSYTYPAWRAVKDTVKHEERVKWESDWLLQDAAQWAAETPGIVWVDHPAFGHKLSQMTGLKYYGGGDGASEEIAEEYAEEKGRSSKSIICSMSANKRGKNFQHGFSRNLFVSLPSSNDVIEQVLGRTYRSGQTADCVTCDYYLHVPELESSLEKARERAAYMAETTGNPQKLLYGVWE